MSTRNEVEYLIGGLEQELRDGLARLERADAADDHVQWYRDHFNEYLRALRRELDSPTPDVYQVAVSAIQAAWLAHIWPNLRILRDSERGPKNFRATNTTKQHGAAIKQQRVMDIAKSLKRPTPKSVRRRYQDAFPGESAPSISAVYRYLALTKK